jgi:hypothetical protein
MLEIDGLMKILDEDEAAETEEPSPVLSMISWVTFLNNNDLVLGADRVRSDHGWPTIVCQLLTLNIDAVPFSPR